MAETIIIDADDDSYEGYSAEEDQGTAVEITDDESPPTGDDSKISSEEDEVEVEGKQTTVSTEKDEVSRLKDEVRELRSALLQTVQQVKQAPAVTTAPKEEKVTKAQLIQILNENKDPETGNIRPDILMNVLDYLVDERTTEVKQKAFEELNQSSWEREIAGVSNRVLNEDKYLAQNPDLNAKIDEIANNLKLGGHPAGRLAAYALIRLSAGDESNAAPVTSAVPKNRTANSGKMDKTHVGNISAKSKSTKLTQEQLQMAKRFGVKPETYARFVKTGG